MTWYLWGYLIVLFSSFFLNLGLSAYAWGRHSTRIDVLFAVVCLSSSLLTLCYIIMMLSANEEMAFFWTRIRFALLALLLVAMFLLVLEKLGYHAWTSWRRAWVFAVIPALANLILWTDHVREWFIASYSYRRVGFIYIENLRFTGFFNFPYIFYNYALYLVAIILLARRLFVYRARYRTQILLLLASIAIVAFASLQRTFEIFNELPNILPIGLAACTVLFAIGVFAFRLMDLSPAAHDAVFTNLPEATFVLDAAKRIVDANDAAVKLLGRPYHALLRRPAATVMPSLAASLAPDAPPGSTTQAQGVAFSDGGASTEPQPIGASAVSYVDVELSPLWERNRLTSGYLLAIRDVTTRKKAQMERDERLELLDSYARTMAHDLKQPLTVINFAADALSHTPGGMSAENEELLNLIKEASTSTSRIIEEILMLARAQNEEALSIGPLAMTQIVNDALYLLQPDFSKANAKWCIEGVLPDAIGHAEWVRRVWVNYLSNAVKYGGHPPVIAIGGKREGGCVRYWVRDNGPGLTVEEQAQLFRSFTRLDRHQGITGTGLGLSMVRVIVAKMGGEVGMESSPDYGSTFYFTLPASP
jgi:signal transduction histidine kinase